MYNNSNSETPIVCATVVHVLPRNIPSFIASLENSPYVIRLIIHKESPDKLWITGEDVHER